MTFHKATNMDRETVTVQENGENLKDDNDD